MCGVVVYVVVVCICFVIVICDAVDVVVVSVYVDTGVVVGRVDMITGIGVDWCYGGVVVYSVEVWCRWC